MKLRQSGAAVLPLLALAVGFSAGSGSYGAAAKKAGTGKTVVKKGPTRKNDTALIAQGKKLVQADGCTGCHKLAGKGGTTAPDLTQIGAKDKAAEIAEKIKSPKLHNPNSIMPPSKRSDKEIAAMAAYLASLK